MHCHTVTIIIIDIINIVIISNLKGDLKEWGIVQCNTADKQMYMI